MAPVEKEPPEAAFDALYRSAVSDLYAYVFSLVRERAAAEDVTATAFERAYRRRASFDPRRGSERAWLFGIARNAALDELRRRGRTAALLADPEDLAAAMAPGEDEEEAARRASVRAAVAALPPRDRELLALRFHAGLDHTGIAAVLGISPTNAGTRLHRVVDRLRKACHASS